MQQAGSSEELYFVLLVESHILGCSYCNLVLFRNEALVFLLLKLLELTEGCDDDSERGSDSDFTLNSDFTSHFLDDLLTDAQSKASASLVDIVVLRKRREVKE